jgi:hypothetical protein
MTVSIISIETLVPFFLGICAAGIFISCLCMCGESNSNQKP